MYFVVNVKKKLTLAFHICVSVRCISRLSIENGMIEYEVPKLQGVRAIYSCNDGYELIGNKFRTCVLTLTWTGHSPMCKRELYFYVKLMVTITKFTTRYMLNSYYMTDNDMPK